MTLHAISKVPGYLRHPNLQVGALCIITGKPYSEVAELVRGYIGQPIKKGLSGGTMQAMLRHFGWAWHAQTVAVSDREAVAARLEDRDPEKPSLAVWLPLRTPEQREQVMLVRLSNNGWVVVQGKKGATGWSRGSVFTSKLPWRRAKVRQVYLIENQALNEQREADARIAAIQLRLHGRDRRALSMVKPQAVLWAKQQGVTLTAQQDGSVRASDGEQYASWTDAREAMRDRRDRKKPLAVYRHGTTEVLESRFG